ncbi:MAG: isochorismatase family protein [Candidatus Heimdallarchaeota archaeon]|nr:isochorismatase family protein [Candidatus Heimdallarchaeota archaeon]
MSGENTIIEEWIRVKVPNPPEIQEVKIKPKETALLVLDVQNSNCNNERRPRCVKTLYKIQTVLEKAREREMTVIFTLTSAASKADMRREVLPKKEELVIKAGVDKFFETELEKKLKENKIKTVIIVGTSANGAVLSTAIGAAVRKLVTIVPIDAISATYPYEEQYTVWHLANSPGTRRSTILTKANLITI